ncbi:MAG TPA: FAD-dependent monooxygenase, partial [Bacteroidales bacterium]|nr:FAD-dependent monooxygenase [Bacteroidales bacterium]
MGFRIIELKLPTGFEEELLHRHIAHVLQIRHFSYQIVSQSLDARNKRNIHWLMQVGVSSEELSGGKSPSPEKIEIPYKKRHKRVLVVGSGPAGFFAAFVLQKAGFETLILERGAEVEKRSLLLKQFEKTGVFSPIANYSFGEGGAGTFSDGKLTSRSKHISKEKAFFLKTYIEAGAPQEIAWLAHPHVGSDILRKVVVNLRRLYLESGGELLFEALLTDLVPKNGRILEAVSTAGSFEYDYFIVAPGHSAYETYRMLINRGVIFRLKNFALGCRAEHPQEFINLSQWGSVSLKGVKAAEYRL